MTPASISAPRIAIIGLGDLGRPLADRLAQAGADVVGFDSSVRKLVGVTLVGSAAEAVAGANIVLSITSPIQANKIARELAPALAPEAIYADLTSGTPSFKRGLAGLFYTDAFADVTTVVSGDDDEPEIALAASGPAAHRVVEIFGGLGIQAEYVSDVPGDAAARALLRSLLAEGVSSALVDTLWAAESLGMQDWAYAEILRQFDASSAEMVKASLRSTAKNFKSLQMEMQDVLEMLSDSGYESTMLAPIQFNHGRIMHGKKIPHARG
jgi:3-hydroxyisobutyrate dehydrogenase-like beta-hydroxyacid dehydrogenase